MRRPLLLLATIATAAPAIAPAQAVPAVAGDLVAILNGGGRIADSFSAAFIADVPEPRLRALAARLVAQNGRALRIASAVPAGRNRYVLTVEQERADASVIVTLDETAPHRIAGLVITGSTARLATISAVMAAFRALPGTVGVAVARLGAGAPQPHAAIAPDRAQAVGSTFKLLVLAELVRAIDAGERRWTDVTPLTVRAVPSGILQDWPAGSPLTLHSLAGLMLSRSDNSATDTLIALLGRDRIAAMGAPLGWPPHAGNIPLLTTLELATLKGSAGGALADRYAAATPVERRAMLAGAVAAVPRSAIDQAALETRPYRIDTVEWFASPVAIVRTLDWFRDRARRRAGAATTALALLAINPGLPAADAARFAYVGYKGGSEAGVLAMHYLVQTRRGDWYAVSASWNDARTNLPEQTMVALVTRLLQHVAEGSPP